MTLRFELWHNTTAGAAVSRGFVADGDRDELIEVAADEYAEVGECVDYTLHIVEAGSYAGFPEPSLGSHNEVPR